MKDLLGLSFPFARPSCLFFLSAISPVFVTVPYFTETVSLIFLQKRRWFFPLS